MACDQSSSCGLFPLMAMDPALILWKKHFCDSVFSSCARYQCSLKSQVVPLTLLPNGKHLAPRSRDEINVAALFNAIEKGCVPIIKSMIKTGVAKIAAQTSRGLSPLMVAARVGNAEIVALMLNHGYNPWRKNPDGDTALDLATIAGHEACMDILLRKMKTTNPDDYARLPATIAESDIEEANGNVVYMLKRLNPYAN